MEQTDELQWILQGWIHSLASLLRLPLTPTRWKRTKRRWRRGRVRCHPLPWSWKLTHFKIDDKMRETERKKRERERERERVREWEREWENERERELRASEHRREHRREMREKSRPWQPSRIFTATRTN